MQMQYEKQMRRKLKPVFEQQRKETIANIQHLGASLTKSFTLFNAPSTNAEMIKATTPLLHDLADVQGGLALSFAGEKVQEFILTQALKDIIAASTKNMADSVNATTLDKLNTTLAEGVQNGEAIGTLEGRVNSVFGELDGNRSEMIARTETLKASNAATVEAYRQTGFVTEKVWVINPDACPECEAFDGKVVGLDENFVQRGDSYSYQDASGQTQESVATYDDVGEPPLHPNCRCTIVPGRESTNG